MSFCFKTIKPDPNIVPWVFSISFIVSNDPGINKKPLPLAERVVTVVNKKGALAGQDIMEEIMVTHGRAVSVPRFAMFTSTMVNIEIGGTLFIRDKDITHSITNPDLLSYLLFYYIILRRNAKYF